MLSSLLEAQSLCIELSRKGEKSIIIKNKQKISFALSNDTLEYKGELTKITKDSLFIERDNSVKGYSVKDFRMIAYIQKSSIVAIATYFIAMGIITAVSGNQSSQAIPLSSVLSNQTPQALPLVDIIQPIKFREKVYLNEGWSATIIELET
jgi:hypothetical protein